jgi:CRISPR-associated protein Cmr1
MILQTYSFEVITPCFCGGAEPDQRAEIRPASIRGQLRWWFRVLGGFKSLAPQSVEEQEAMIFGAAAGDDGAAGMLMVRVKNLKLITSRKNSEALGHQPFTAPAFLTFPLQSTRNMDGTRGVIDSGSFTVQFLWRGNPALKDDLAALATVFGNLGSLGFRSRRAMGALACSGGNITQIADALARFNQTQAICIRKLNAQSSVDAISKLGGWLKSCRAHGRSGQNQAEQQSPYFKYAKNDHDIGYNMQATAQSPAFRPALGLPIIQRTQHGTNQWNQRQNASGRFASPVILRPHKDAQGHWHALVIFVDAKKWPQGQRVYLNGQPRAVSLDLYDAMKHDDRLQPFP